VNATVEITHNREATNHINQVQSRRTKIHNVIGLQQHSY